MSERPNILLITTDEQRYELYGVERSNWPALPNLARLRAESTTLTNAYANCPICMPCRYTWVTGLYGSQTERGPVNGYDWPDYHRTMPQALQRAGYHTALIGKLHSCNVGTLTRHHLNDLEQHSRIWGFDTIYECSGRDMWPHALKDGRYGIKGCHYTDHLKSKGLYDKALRECIDRDKSRKAFKGLEPYRPGVLAVEDTLDGFIVNEMCGFINNYQEPQPFYLHASFFGPHYPLDVPPEYFERYRPGDMPPPTMIDDPQLIRRWQENRAMYMALNALVDEQIGRLLRTLEERGLMDNTVIMFTTDHGDMLGDDNFARKNVPHEGSCRTPIMLRYPGRVPAGRILPGLAEAADVPHTIMDVAGLSEGERTAALPMSLGRSLLDYAADGGPLFRDGAYAEFGGDPSGFSMRMMRSGSWKYVRAPGYGDRLYDLDADPQELHNRLNEPDCAVKLRALQEKLIDRMATIRPPPLQGKFHGDDVMRGVRHRVFTDISK